MEEELVLIDTAFYTEIYAKQAYEYIKPLSDSTPQYLTWFGQYTNSCKKPAKDHFSSIVSHPISDSTFICTLHPELYTYVCTCISQMW